MTSEQKTAWVAALRSGQFAQGQGYLRVRTGNAVAYCCLGVAREVCGVQTYHHNTSQFYLDEEFLDQVIQSQLAVMNDAQAASFAQIADFIEQNIPASDAGQKGDAVV